MRAQKICTCCYVIQYVASTSIVKHDYSKHTYNELKIIVIFIPCDFLHIVNLMNIMLITKLITKHNRLLLALCYSVLIYYYYCS